MASSKAYLDYILEQLFDLEEIAYRAAVRCPVSGTPRAEEKEITEICI